LARKKVGGACRRQRKRENKTRDGGSLGRTEKGLERPLSKIYEGGTDRLKRDIYPKHKKTLGGKGSNR